MIEDHGGPLFRFAAPITFQRECSNCHEEYSGARVQGCISIAFPALGVFRELKRNQMYLFLYLLVSLLVVFSLLGFLLKRSILDPLNGFMVASGEIEEGDLGVRVDLEDRGDEWGRLAESFNKMVDQDFPQKSLLGEGMAFRTLDCTFQISERAGHSSLAHIIGAWEPGL